MNDIRLALLAGREVHDTSTWERSEVSLFQGHKVHCREDLRTLGQELRQKQSIMESSVAPVDIKFTDVREIGFSSLLMLNRKYEEKQLFNKKN